MRRCPRVEAVPHRLARCETSTSCRRSPPQGRRRPAPISMEFESTAGRHLTADVSPGTARRLYEGGTSIYLREVAQLAPLGAALANDLVMPGRRRPVHLHVVATPWLDVVLDTPRGRLIREPSLRVGADDLRDPARRDAMLAAASRPPHPTARRPRPRSPPRPPASTSPGRSSSPSYSPGAATSAWPRRPPPPPIALPDIDSSARRPVPHDGRRAQWITRGSTGWYEPSDRWR